MSVHFSERVLHERVNATNGVLWVVAGNRLARERDREGDA